MTVILRTIISEETARWCVERYPDRVRAIVLTGSLARDEATLIEEGKRRRILGDAEFIVVFHERSALPRSPELESVRQRIERELLRRDIVCRVSLSAAHPKYFRQLKPHIFAYELKTCGQVVLGDGRILSLIPAFSPSDVPLEDAWRMLCNRMVELIDVLREFGETQAESRLKVQYQVTKLYLDMATSYLLFMGGYEPTYQGRAERLRALAEHPPEEIPFPLKDFAERVGACTRAKLGGFEGGRPFSVGEEAGPASWEEAFRDAQRLWRWELKRLTGRTDPLPDRVLLESWMQLQKLRERVRGWLFVLRKKGWHRSWRHWPRWGRYGWRASPRYWIYAAASELFFSLPLLARPGGEGQPAPDWEGLRSLLPMTAGVSSEDRKTDWQQLASDIAWNYHEFLEGTRA